MELFKQEMELFILLPDLQSKNFFYKRFVITSKDSIIVLKTENRIIQTGNGIISSTSGPSILKLLLQNGSNFYQQV